MHRPNGNKSTVLPPNGNMGNETCVYPEVNLLNLSDLSPVIVLRNIAFWPFLVSFRVVYYLVKNLIFQSISEETSF